MLRFLIAGVFLVLLIFLLIIRKQNPDRFPGPVFIGLAALLFLGAILSMFMLKPGVSKRLGTLPLSNRAETFGIGKAIQAETSPGEVILIVISDEGQEALKLLNDGYKQGLEEALDGSHSVRVVTEITSSFGASNDEENEEKGNLESNADVSGAPVAVVTYSSLPRKSDLPSECKVYASTRVFSNRRQYESLLRSGRLHSVIRRKPGRPAPITSSDLQQIFDSRFDLIRN